jgi:hypothetical protein
MSDADRVYKIACRALGLVTVAVGRLGELRADTELKLLARRLQSLAYKAEPTPTRDCIDAE